MKINRALGLGLLLLILQMATADIWDSLEATIIGTLDVTQTALVAAEKGIEQMPSFPTTPTIPSF